jgi:hypothetical protein
MKSLRFISFAKNIRELVNGVVVELVDTTDLKSVGFGRVGSNPTNATINSTLLAYW